MPASILLNEPNAWMDLASYRTQLKQTYSRDFRLMTADQQAMVRYRLVDTALLIWIEAEEHLNRGRLFDLNGCANELERCTSLLDLLDHTPARGQPETVTSMLNRERNNACPLKYTGLLARLDLEQKMQAEDRSGVSIEDMIKEIKQFVQEVNCLKEAKDATDSVAAIRAKLGEFNDVRRLWWVWGASIFAALYAFFAHPSIDIHLPHQAHMNDTINQSASVFGFISWWLYFFRGFMDFGKAVVESYRNYHPNTVHSQVKLEDVGFMRRLWGRIKALKLSFINDFFWGITNALCALYLVPPNPIKAQWNLNLTAIVLLMDVMVTLWAYYDAYTAHCEKLKQLNHQQTAVINQIAQVLETNAFKNKWPEEQEGALNHALVAMEQSKPIEIFGKRLTQQDEEYAAFMLCLSRYKQIKSARAQEEFEWVYQNRLLLNQLAFTLNLLFGFSLYCGFFSPALGGAFGQALMGVVGGIFCFGATIIFNAMNVAVAYQKARASEQTLREVQLPAFIKRFNASRDEEERKLLFLQMQSAMILSNYERKLANYYLKTAPLKTFVDLATPTFFFFMTHFVFLGGIPIATMIGLVAASIVVVVAVNRLMQAWAPKRPEPNSHFFQQMQPGDALSTTFEQFNTKGTIGISDVLQLLPSAASERQSRDRPELLGNATSDPRRRPRGHGRLT